MPTSRRKRQADEGNITVPPNKRAALEDRTRNGVRDSMPTRELAKPYLLAVGRLPLDVLDTTWSTGRNRVIERRHVHELHKAFKTNGLQRRDPANRLLCLCSADDVRRIQRIASDDNPDKRPEDETDLLRWADMNSGSVEVMAGQHRIAALREYVRDSGSQEDELWWTCELYDRHRLPRPLALRMRLNRTDLTMPDSNGQIWLQLVSIVSDESNGVVSAARDGSGDDRGVGGDLNIVDYKLAESLWLGSEHRFLARRLVTLWHNRRWREMATRWCQTMIGLGSFSIAMFEGLVSYRIDEYLFGLFDSTIDAVRALPVDTTAHVTYADWDRLAAALDRGDRSRPSIEAVFYSGGCGDRGDRIRAAGLLSTLSDDEYARVCKFVVDTPTMTFPTHHRFKRADAKHLGYMMYHIIAWIDPSSATAAGAHSRTMQNKTLLRTHLEAALKTYAASGRREPPPPSVFSPGPAALRLQKLVLDFTLTHADEFYDCDVPLTALGHKCGVDDALYAERFAHGVWARLLLLVRRELSALGLGSGLRTEWKATMEEGAGGSKSAASAIPDLIKALCCQITRATTEKRDTSTLSAQRAAQLERSIQEAVDNTVTAFLSPASPRSPSNRSVSPRPGVEAAGRTVGEVSRDDKPTTGPPSPESDAEIISATDDETSPGSGILRASPPEEVRLASRGTGQAPNSHGTTATATTATVPAASIGLDLDADDGELDRGQIVASIADSQDSQPCTSPVVTSSPPPAAEPSSNPQPSHPQPSASGIDASGAPRSLAREGKAGGDRSNKGGVSSSSSSGGRRRMRPRWALGPKAISE